MILNGPGRSSIAYRGQLVHVFVGGAERSQSQLLRELREARVGQQRHVSKDLVAAVPATAKEAPSVGYKLRTSVRLQSHSRLGCVERVGRVADVLRAVEHAEGQSCQEVPRRQVACHRAQLEARRLCERTL